jgi:hypothetical protein
LNAAELLEQHPQLTLGQIFSALAYYWDHQSEMDVLLAADELETERLLNRVELEEKVTAGWVSGFSIYIKFREILNNRSK